MGDKKPKIVLCKQEFPYDGGVVVIACGDVNGHFELLFKKMLTINKKCGRLACAVCVGDFFREGCEEQWERVLKGDISPCCRTFILGPSRQGLVKFYPDCNRMVNFTNRITFLGKSGVFITSEGLKLAYVSGTFSPQAHIRPSPIHYSYKHIHDLLEQSNYNSRIDILLTSLCPHNFGWLPGTNNFPTNTEMASGFLYSFLMPKYQMATTDKEAFETATMRYFKNHYCAGASRFFGIPAAGKKKWMKALNLTPSTVENPDGKLNISHLLQLDIPEIHEFWHIVQNEATSPLTKQPRTNFFFDVPSSRRSEERRMSRKQHHRNKKSHKKKDGKCWFCLSTCVDEKHLVISVGSQAFLALAKGPIIKDHVLITTLEHRRAVRILDESARKEIEKYKKALMKYFMPYRVPVFYERACKSSHLQVHCVPIPNNKVKHLVPAAKELAFKYELEITEYPNTRQSFMSLPPEKLYFHIEVPNGVDLLIDADDNFPLHFGRELLVMRNLLNLPEKKSWRHCIQPKEIETKAAEEFKCKFEKFDFNLTP